MKTRRTFLTRAGLTVLAATAAPAVHARRATHDLVIRRGTVLDGTGAAGRQLDLAIDAGRIRAIGTNIDGTGREEIDARDLTVAPGFIDIHSHGDAMLAEDPRAESVIRQGITTIVVGADGSSRATGADDAPFATLFMSIERLQPSPNVASMVGLGSVRGSVIGDTNRTATPTELARMTAMVTRALEDGACGASSGLEYTPGAFASLEELAALAAPLAARRLPYATHMRNEDDRLLEAIDEAIAVARAAGCPLQISHLKTQGPRNWAKLDDVFRRIDGARRAGVDVAFDRYPYVAYATGLTNLFPVWSRAGGTAAFLARLANHADAPRIQDHANSAAAAIGGWDHVQLTSVRADADRAAEGQRLGTYARARGLDPYACAVGLLERSQGIVGMVGFAMSEENLERLLAHPLGMVCTDGGAFATDGPTRRGSPHPRGIGSVPRVLGHYVRERKVLTLPDAVRKLTSLPAGRLRLDDRGRLAPGRAADVVVFDPETVADTATYGNPFQYPRGISTVIVNGVVTIGEGQRRKSLGAGQALRVPGASRR